MFHVAKGESRSKLLLKDWLSWMIRALRVKVRRFLAGHLEPEIKLFYGSYGQNSVISEFPQVQPTLDLRAHWKGNGRFYAGIGLDCHAGGGIFAAHEPCSFVIHL